MSATTAELLRTKHRNFPPCCAKQTVRKYSQGFISYSYSTSRHGGNSSKQQNGVPAPIVSGSCNCTSPAAALANAAICGCRLSTQSPMQALTACRAAATLTAVRFVQLLWCLGSLSVCVAAALSGTHTNDTTAMQQLNTAHPTCSRTGCNQLPVTVHYSIRGGYSLLMWSQLFTLPHWPPLQPSGRPAATHVVSCNPTSSWLQWQTKWLEHEVAIPQLRALKKGNRAAVAPKLPGTETAEPGPAS